MTTKKALFLVAASLASLAGSTVRRPFQADWLTKALKKEAYSLGKPRGSMVGHQVHIPPHLMGDPVGGDGGSKVECGVQGSPRAPLAGSQARGAPDCMHTHQTCILNQPLTHRLYIIIISAS